MTDPTPLDSTETIRRLAEALATANAALAVERAKVARVEALRDDWHSRALLGDVGRPEVVDKVGLPPTYVRETLQVAAQRLDAALAEGAADHPQPEVTYAVTHGWTPGKFSDRCHVMLARYPCPYSQEQHPPGPPENIDAFGYRR